jgi:hypothetical protein
LLNTSSRCEVLNRITTGDETWCYSEGMMIHDSWVYAAAKAKRALTEVSEGGFE